MKNADFSADINVWLEFSLYDLKSAQWQFKGEIYTSSCYASQQSAEKALKALVLACEKIIPKIHSLDRLISLLKKSGIKTESIEDFARELDKYYITTRYPGQYGGPEGMYDKKDAEMALVAAKAILEFVEKQLEKKGIKLKTELYP